MHKHRESFHGRPPCGERTLLLRTALERVPCLAFSQMVERWRWKVFAGEIEPADYNASWWELERAYQGTLILTFGGGVNEIQRDLIAMFGLGMPRTPRM